jgi:hypothetical protein
LRKAQAVRCDGQTSVTMLLRLTITLHRMGTIAMLE